MQTEILEAKPAADVRVYAVFFEMVDGDRGARSRVRPEEILSDPRVSVFWDEGKIVGRSFDEHVTKLGAREDRHDRIEWDCFFLYDPRAEWTEVPPSPVSWGRPIITERERLRRGLERVLERAAEN